MVAFIFLAVLGSALVVLGVNRIKNPILWYNRAKVPEEYRTIFGKLMGTAQIIGGIGILLFSVMSFLTISTTKPIWAMIGICLMIVMLAVAICIYIFTMIKYYKRIS